MKQIILCADDYSQTPAISQGILALLQEKRLSAASCMSNSVHWINHAEYLKPFINRVDLGLHLNLTEGYPLTGASGLLHNGQFMGLGQLFLQAKLNRLDKQAITTELNAQLDQFISGMGTLPDFIDGHQHIHHFPVIRDSVLKIYQDRLKNQGVYLRSVACSRPYTLKKLALEFTGAHRFKQELIRRNIPHNTSFSGVYPFTNNINTRKYRILFINFLRDIQDNGLIMCHPCLNNTSNSELDPINKNRVAEFKYLSSNNFLQDCEDNNIEIGRFLIKS